MQGKVNQCLFDREHNSQSPNKDQCFQQKMGTSNTTAAKIEQRLTILYDFPIEMSYSFAEE